MSTQELADVSSAMRLANRYTSLIRYILALIVAVVGWQVSTTMRLNAVEAKGVEIATRIEDKIFPKLVEHSTAISDYQTFKAQGPRFGPSDASILRSAAVNDAMAYTDRQLAARDPKYDELNRNITELKVLMADLKARLPSR